MFMCSEKVTCNVYIIPSSEVVDLAGARFGLDILRIGSGLAPTKRMFPRIATKMHQISVVCLNLNIT